MDNINISFTKNEECGHVDMEIVQKFKIPNEVYDLFPYIIRKKNKETPFCRIIDNKKEWNILKDAYSLMFSSYKDNLDILKKSHMLYDKIKDNKQCYDLDICCPSDIYNLFMEPVFEYCEDNIIMDGIYSSSRWPDDKFDVLNKIIPIEIIRKATVSASLIRFACGQDYIDSHIFLDYLVESLYYIVPANTVKTYIMKDVSGLYKIGKSVIPEERLKLLRIGNPTIELCFYIEGNKEHELHLKFSRKRVNGEWFRLSTDDLEYIKNCNT